MKKLILTVFLSVACVTVLRADIFQVDLNGSPNGTLNGGVEVPPNNSTATGGEVGSGITYDNSTMTLSVDVAYGLSVLGFGPLQGSFTQGTINEAAVGQAGSSVITLIPTQVDTHSGFFQQTVVLTPALETALFADQLYMNVSSSLFQNGEIRAQLIPTSVPEPGTFAIIGAGLAGLLFLRRRTA